MLTCRPALSDEVLTFLKLSMKSQMQQTAFWMNVGGGRDRNDVRAALAKLRAEGGTRRGGLGPVREKDGLWAALLWLNVLAKRRQSVADIVASIGARMGEITTRGMTTKKWMQNTAADLMSRLREKLGTLSGQRIKGREIAAANDVS